MPDVNSGHYVHSFYPTPCRECNLHNRPASLVSLHPRWLGWVDYSIYRSVFINTTNLDLGKPSIYDKKGRYKGIKSRKIAKIPDYECFQIIQSVEMQINR